MSNWFKKSADDAVDIVESVSKFYLKFVKLTGA